MDNNIFQKNMRNKRKKFKHDVCFRHEKVRKSTNKFQQANSPSHINKLDQFEILSMRKITTEPIPLSPLNFYEDSCSESSSDSFDWKSYALMNPVERKEYRNKKDLRLKYNDPNREEIIEPDELCFFQFVGNCITKNCPKSHEFRTPRKQELCRFYGRGYCNNPNTCICMHSEFPCMYYYMGIQSHMQRSCLFSHGKPLSTSLFNVLLKHITNLPTHTAGGIGKYQSNALELLLAQHTKLCEQYQTSNEININYINVKNNECYTSSKPRNKKETIISSELVNLSVKSNDNSVIEISNPFSDTIKYQSSTDDVNTKITHVNDKTDTTCTNEDSKVNTFPKHTIENQKIIVNNTTIHEMGFYRDTTTTVDPQSSIGSMKILPPLLPITKLFSNHSDLVIAKIEDKNPHSNIHSSSNDFSEFIHTRAKKQNLPRMIFSEYDNQSLPVLHKQTFSDDGDSSLIIKEDSSDSDELCDKLTHPFYGF